MFSSRQIDAGRRQRFQVQSHHAEWRIELIKVCLRTEVDLRSATEKGIDRGGECRLAERSGAELFSGVGIGHRFGIRVRGGIGIGHVVVADGLVRFFIDWQDSPHPSQRGADGVTLIGLRAEHPDPLPMQRALSQLGLDLTVQAGREAALIADLACPRGRVELR